MLQFYESIKEEIEMIHLSIFEPIFNIEIFDFIWVFWLIEKYYKLTIYKCFLIIILLFYLYIWFIYYFKLKLKSKQLLCPIN